MFAEWLISIAALVISVIFLIVSRTFPETVADPGGLTLFPRALSLITGGAALILLGQLYRRSRETAPWKSAWAWTRGSVRPDAATHKMAAISRQTIYIFILSAIYPYAILKLGFLAATALFVYILLSMFGTGKIKNLLLSLVITSMIYIFFVGLIGAPVSRGDWINLLLDLRR